MQQLWTRGSRLRLFLAVAAVCVIKLAASSPITASSWTWTPGTGGTSARFYSPSHNLSCELADRDVRGSYVYCQSVKLPHSVTMSLTGRLKICRSIRCLGNAAVNTPTLGYGKQITVGRFGCRSLRSGIRCTVIRSGTGFLIDSKVVRRVGR